MTSPDTLEFTVTAADEEIILLVRGLSLKVDSSTFVEVTTSIENSSQRLQRVKARRFEETANNKRAPLGQEIAKKTKTTQEPHWFAAKASETATKCDELFIRAGSAKNGMKVKITGIQVQYF